MALSLLPEGAKCRVKRAAVQLTFTLGTDCVMVSASVVSQELSPSGTESPSLPPAPASETPPVFAALPSPEAPPVVVLPPFPVAPASGFPPMPSLPPDAPTPEPALPPADAPAPPLLSSTVRPQATTTNSVRAPRATFEGNFIILRIIATGMPRPKRGSPAILGASSVGDWHSGTGSDL